MIAVCVSNLRMVFRFLVTATLRQWRTHLRLLTILFSYVIPLEFFHDELRWRSYVHFSRVNFQLKLTPARVPLPFILFFGFRSSVLEFSTLFVRPPMLSPNPKNGHGPVANQIRSVKKRTRRQRRPSAMTISINPPKRPPVSASWHPDDAQRPQDSDVRKSDIAVDDALSQGEPEQEWRCRMRMRSRRVESNNHKPITQCRAYPERYLFLLTGTLCWRVNA